MFETKAMQVLIAMTCGLVLPASGWAQELPKVNDEALQVSLFAAEPMIQTPTGAVFDGKGRLLVIESQTHFRPKDWTGPQHDQVVWLEDTDADGKADKRTVVFGETDFTMDIAWHPEGWIYLATRDEILRWRDDDDNGLPDKVERKIVFLDTKGNYPHNGLSGLAFDKNGDLYFGMGENLGAAYKLRGADDEITDQGEGGNIFWCTKDGKRLKRIATGFWNPFGVCVDPWGNVFATDNDPDSRPPCRLHHIVNGGDYGYQFRYGRSGLHPFVSWNGELNGTLPMLAGTGEAPCDVIFYAPQTVGGYAGLGASWNGTLLVASWVDHRVESYTLTPKDGTFSAKQKMLLEGGADFRPVAFATAPDGSLYVTDWVKRNYELHGQGRVWCVKAKSPTGAAPAAPARPVSEPGAELRERILDGESPTVDEAKAWLTDSRPYIRSAAIWRLGREGALVATLAEQSWADPKLDSGVLLAARSAVKVEGGGIPRPAITVLLRSLAHPSDEVVILALKWISDDRLKGFRSAVKGCLDHPNVSAAVYYSALTALARMDNAEVKEEDLVKQLKADLSNTALPAARRRLALEIFPDRDRHLTAADVVPVLEAAEAKDKPWLLHYLGTMADLKRNEPLKKFALDGKSPDAARMAAMVHAVFEKADADQLIDAALETKNSDALRRAALQALQGVRMDGAQVARLKSMDVFALHSYSRRAAGEAFATIKRPQLADVPGWVKYLKTVPGANDLANGQLVFMSAKLGGCTTCHRAEGIGNTAGPNLSTIGAVQTASGDQLLESLLQPSRNVAPRYECFNIQTLDGLTRLGFPLHERGSEHTYVDIGGNKFVVKIDDLVKRQPMPVSIMPEGLVSRLTDEEVRDLLAYLASLKE